MNDERGTMNQRPTTNDESTAPSVNSSFIVPRSSLAVVTGGSRGLGGFLAERLALDGWDLVLVARDERKLAERAEAIRAVAPGCGVQTVAVDVADAEAVREKLGTENDERGTMNDELTTDGQRSPVVNSSFIVHHSSLAVLNAAAVLGPVGKLLDNDPAQWEYALRANLLGTANCLRALLPALCRAERRGKIINFSGGGAASPRVQHTAYACAKTACVRLTEILALEYPEVDINIIAPGAHRTGIWDEETHDQPPAQWADPERLWALVRFLLSPASDGITGRFLHINDPWESLDARVSETEKYTLRRVEER